jgi:hypothetical protein
MAERRRRREVTGQWSVTANIDGYIWDTWKFDSYASAEACANSLKARLADPDLDEVKIWVEQRPKASPPPADEDPTD